MNKTLISKLTTEQSLLFFLQLTAKKETKINIGIGLDHLCAEYNQLENVEGFLFKERQCKTKETTQIYSSFKGGGGRES